MLTSKELQQLREMSRPNNEGRLASHELLCKAVLHLLKRVDSLESQITALNVDMGLVSDDDFEFDEEDESCPDPYNQGFSSDPPTGVQNGWDE